MYECQICRKPQHRVIRAYRYECGDCRQARKALKKSGSSFEAIRTYLRATGLVKEFKRNHIEPARSPVEPQESTKVVPLRKQLD